MGVVFSICWHLMEHVGQRKQSVASLYFATYSLGSDSLGSGEESSPAPNPKGPSTKISAVWHFSTLRLFH